LATGASPKSRKILLSIAALLIAVFSVVVLLAARARIQARTALDEFMSLGTSDDPTSGFKTLQQKYGRKLQANEHRVPEICQYALTNSNGQLAAMHVVPYAEMVIYCTVYKGKLVDGLIEYRAALHAEHRPTVHIQQGMCAHGCSASRFDVSPHGTANQIWNGLVELRPRATPQERSAALALNLDCITKFSGCKDITEFLPTMWAHVSPTSVKSLLIGESQRLEETHQFPSSDDF
jgi:hypothetical protein